MKIVRRFGEFLAPKIPTGIQIGGAGCLTAATYLAWGLPPGLAAGGVLLILFGVAAERDDAERGD